MALNPEFAMELPASSANLGPAFDTAALAWNRWLRVEAQRADEFRVSARGRDAERCGEAREHLILNVYREVMEAAGGAAAPLALELDNEIPIGKGCGSSAAARLAGVALAVRFGRLKWTAQRVVEEAARREGHADNAAACWWGGLAVTQTGAEGELRWLRVAAGQPWALLLAVPAQGLATEVARAALPASYGRGEAVANVQNAVLLIEAWRQGRGEMLRSAMEDRMHEPYRAALCPLLGVMRPLAGHDGILGCALSGAGPSVLVIARDGGRAKAAMQAAMRRAGMEGEILEAAMVEQGPGVSWDSR
ncbi:MAG: homoserine kinase [Terriglobales bacterium]